MTTVPECFLSGTPTILLLLPETNDYPMHISLPCSYFKKKTCIFTRLPYENTIACNSIHPLWHSPCFVALYILKLKLIFSEVASFDQHGMITTFKGTRENNDPQSQYFVELHFVSNYRYAFRSLKHIANSICHTVAYDTCPAMHSKLVKTEFSPTF